MKSIQKLKNLKGKKVLLRTDFNVSLGRDGSLSKQEALRIEKSLITIKFLMNKGARVIIISHIGRDEKDSLLPVFTYLKKKIKLSFLGGRIDDSVRTHVDAMKNGEVVLLENLRQDKGEIENSSSFARGLSRLADLFVNDAFAVCHRRHASIVGIPKFLPSYSGFLLEEEVKKLSFLVKKPKKPFVFILGGAKFETKLPLIKKYIDITDTIFVGGALQNNFLKAKGFEVGASLVDTKRFNLGSLLKTKKIVLPVDLLVKRQANTLVVDMDKVEKNDIIVDIGPKSIAVIVEATKKAKTILWNGPLGLYEDGFTVSTEAVAKAVAKSSAETVVGGGDTVVTIEHLKLDKKIGFVSTGGGAMLVFLEKGRLPGIDVL